MADGAWQAVLAAEDFAGTSGFTRDFDRLPLAGSDNVDPRETLGHLGFEVGDAIPDARGKPLFVAVVPPEGWRLRPRSDSYYIDVTDPSDVVRATVFFKPAFYDRRADIRIHPRFAIETRDDGARTTWCVIDRALGERAFSSDPVGPVPDAGDEAAFDAWSKEYDAARRASLDWLARNRPEGGPLAYWEDVPAPAPAP
jgi:hypothetical protein